MDMPRKKPALSDGQRALVKRMLAGDNARELIATHLDTARYVDPDRDAAERRPFFERFPTALVPSSLLQPGQAIRHRLTGKDLIITRDPDGQVHVLGNSCSHRATTLLHETGVQDARKLVCPYHAWVYNLGGDLIGLPRPKTFPGLCKEDQGLVRYPAKDVGGMIFHIGDPMAPADFTGIDMLEADFIGAGIGASRIYRSAQHEVASNWKMLVDNFCESYHVKRLHAGSIGGFFADGVTVSDRTGPHQRFVVGRTDHQGDIDAKDWPTIRKAMTLTYQIFPATVVIVSPHYTSVMTIFPGDDVGHCRVEDFMLVPDDADPTLEPKWERSWNLLHGTTFAIEDFGAAAKCQAGVEAGYRETILLGALEQRVQTFHDECDRRLAEAGNPVQAS